MNILIISEYIAPMQAVASIRWTKIAKYIKKNHPDARITVLTDHKDYEAGPSAVNLQCKDTLLEADMACFDEYWQVPNGKLLTLYYGLKHKKGAQIASEIKTEKCSLSERKKFLSHVRIELMDIIYEVKSWLQYRQAKKYIKKKPLNFDVVVSSYGPTWPHMLAEKVKEKKSDVLWIADFRDSYAKDTDTPIALKRHKSFVPRHCSSADLLTIVNDSILTYSAKEQAVETFPNGYDLDEAVPASDPERFSFVFTGTLYGDQLDLGMLFRTLREMFDEGSLDPADVEVHYAGGDGEKAKKFAEKWNCHSIFINHAMVSRPIAKELQSNAAVLVQQGINRPLEKLTWTGKTFEYMMVKKPIVYYTFGEVPYGEASRKIHLLGGCCYEQARHEETYPAVKAYIREKYLEWKKTGKVSIEYDEEYVKQFSYENIAERYWKAMNKNYE